MQGGGEEKLAHLVRGGQSLHLALEPGGVPGAGQGEGGGAGLEAEGVEKTALSDWPSRLDSFPSGGGKYGGKVGVDREIRLARVGEGILPDMPAESLQGVAQPGLRPAIVNQEGGAAFRGDPSPDF